MKRWIFLALAAPLLTACPMSPTEFVVSVGDTNPVGATLTLYDEESSMNREGNMFVDSRVIKRDGSGEILIVYADDENITCTIGYVTRGMDTRMRFEIRDGVCHAD